jgi:isopropylmalate/homocitrate/citramalate synthase
LQSISRIMPTPYKLRWIDALYVAGLREIEVCSFVPAKLLLQIAQFIKAEHTRGGAVVREANVKLD